VEDQWTRRGAKKAHRPSARSGAVALDWLNRRVARNAWQSIMGFAISWIACDGKPSKLLHEKLGCRTTGEQPLIICWLGTLYRTGGM
jgi:hypothetical protein